MCANKIRHVAVIGAGPSGLAAAKYVLFQSRLHVLPLLLSLSYDLVFNV